MSEYSSEAYLVLEMKHRLGALEIDAAFNLTKPWTILFGPSGSGKSTILRAIAGHLDPDHARISIPHKTQTQVATDTSRGIFIPAHQRLVRWSAQRPNLFPHMTVRENLQFATRTLPHKSVEATLDRFHLTHIADRKPVNLSGGEQQRVAIARTAASSSGHLLLLDEPFSGLDAPLRDELLADLQLWAAETNTPILSVTHDISEAFQLNAEILKLHNGRITAQGPAAIVLAEERNRLLAQLSGHPAP